MSKPVANPYKSISGFEYYCFSSKKLTPMDSTRTHVSVCHTPYCSLGIYIAVSRFGHVLVLGRMYRKHSMINGFDTHTRWVWVLNPLITAFNIISIGTSCTSRASAINDCGTLQITCSYDIQQAGCYF